MILHIVSVFDSAAQAYNRPFFVPAIGIANRSFSDEVNRVAADNQMSQHPDDFELYKLGTFDDSTGEFATHSPELLTRAKDVVSSS